MSFWGITPKPEPDHAPFWGVTPKAEAPWTVQAVPVKQEGRVVKQEGRVVKQEGLVVKQEGERRWQAVVKQEEPNERKIRIRLVHQQDKPPWAGPVPRDEASAYERGPLPAPAIKEKALEEPRSSKRARKQREASPSQNSRTAVTARNYVAVEAGRGDYGLIDMGPDRMGGGGQSVLVHVRRRHPAPWRVLAEIRPGATLQASPVSGGPPVPLRVRYTTPARYYSPGTRITTLSVAVDSADWRCLRADAPRI